MGEDAAEADDDAAAIERAIRDTVKRERAEGRPMVERLRYQRRERQAQGKIVFWGVLGVVAFAAPLLLFAGLLHVAGSFVFPESVPGQVQVIAVPADRVVSGTFVSDDGKRRETVIDMPVTQDVKVGDTVRARYLGGNRASQKTRTPRRIYLPLIGLAVVSLLPSIAALLWGRNRRAL